METKKQLRILLIEDSDNDAQLLLREIRRAGYDVEYERVETPEAMRRNLETRVWDVVLCDYSLPQFDAPRALDVLKSTDRDLPFIIVSGTIGEESAVSALKAGAHDFIIKGKFARLGPGTRNT
jgi:DNA-binding NtrC family response regulator